MSWTLEQIAVLVASVLGSAGLATAVCWFVWGRKAATAPVLEAPPTPAELAAEQKAIADVQTGQGATQADLDKVLGRKT